MDRQIVVFLLAGQQYGVDIGQVYEIIRAGKTVSLPGAPSYLEGVIHVREHIIPVVDLGARLGLSPGEKDAGSERILIVDAGGAMVGLRVDAVKEVRVLGSGELKPPPGYRQSDGGYLEGIALVGDELIIMLDAKKLFGREETNLLTAAGQGVA